MINKIFTKSIISEGLNYHFTNNIPLAECVFRYGSEAHFGVINEARQLWREGKIEVDSYDQFLLETDLGTFGEYRGEQVPLDLPMIVNEAEYQGRKVQLNKPKRGGSKKFYVYVKDPKTKRVKKVNFGAKGGGQSLKVKFKDPKIRKAFADRHNCDTKKDRTKPGYWSCNLPRYAKQLGLGSNMNTFW